MALVVLIPTLILAVVVLRGWPVGLDPWMHALIALAALGAGLTLMNLLTPSSAAPRFKIARRPRGLDRITGVTVIVVGLGFLFFILGAGPAATQQLSYIIFDSGRSQTNAADEEEEDWSEADSELVNPASGYGAQTEVSTAYNPDGSTVPSSVNLNPSDKPEVSLEFSDIDDAKRLREFGPVYVTAFSYNFFDGHVWTSQSARRPRVLNSDEEGWIHLTDTPARSPAYDYTILHGRYFDSPNTVKTLHGAHYVGYSEITRSLGDVLLLPELDPSATYYEYPAGSTPLQFEALVANNAPIVADATEVVYLEPTSHSELHRRILDLSNQFPQELDTERRLLALLNWLRNDFKYSLVINYPENEKCALENFLNDPSGAGGFCIHFASAAALIAREMGVPSRISFGWTGGQFFPYHRKFIFRSEHAHAWTEIYLEDHGWVIFDATPSRSLPQSSASAPGELPPPLDEFLYGEGEASFDSSAFSWLDWKWAAIVCAIGLAVLMILLVCKRRGTGSAMVGGSIPIGAAPTPNYLKLFHQACSHIGQPMPTGRTLCQHLDWLKDEDIAVQFGEDLLSYHYDITYRNLPRDPQAEKQLTVQIKGWET
ncbi:MAG: transglutaminase domain-containing protein [Verrucomicrobiota bacterium]